MSRRKIAEAYDRAREAILVAAKKQYADHGLEQSSVRTIAEAAAVNSAMLNYYFGSKDGLVHELVTSIVDALSAARIETLERLRERHGEPIPVEALVRSIAEPFFDERHPLAEVCRVYVRFLGRLLAEPLDDLSEEVQNRVRPSHAACLSELRKAAPQVDEQELNLRFVLMISSIPLMSVSRSSVYSMSAELAAARVDPDPGVMLDLFVNRWTRMLKA